MQQRLAPLECTLEQHLDTATGRLATVQPRWDHAGIVENQQITRTEPLAEFTELGVSPDGRLPVDDQQA